MATVRDNPTHERWAWTELLAFDVTQPDLGVAAYCETLGFAPDAISVLISTPDFVLQHEVDAPEAAELPPDVCSRNGHDGNEVRRRQVWTKGALRALLAELHRAGCRAYLSNFTRHMHDEFHDEFLTAHPECLTHRADLGRVSLMNILSRLADGTYLEDLFVGNLVKVCDYYGFDGWHGPDGYGPLSTPIFLGDCSDDMIGQFGAATGIDLPAVVTDPSGDDLSRLAPRMEWIWAHARQEWIDFWSTRWATFWGKVSDAMHASGRQAYVNSAWTRDPFEALYRYGVDYRKLAAAGIDGMVPETVAGSISLGSGDRDYHYDYLAMLLLIRAYVPDIKLIFLHPIKDVVEDWDLLRHAPAMLEREIYSLANVYYTQADGTQRRCVDGFLACLADGITAEEWRWLHERWTLSFQAPPARVVGATLVWSDEAMAAHVKEFPRSRDWSAHRIVHRLMAVNGPVQSAVRAESAAHAPGPLLVANPHLFPADQRQTVLDAVGPVIAIGRTFPGWPDPDHEWLDGGEQPMRCRLYHVDGPVAVDALNASAVSPDAFEPPASEPAGFRDELVFAPVSDDFVRLCAEVIRAVSGACSVQAHTTHVISDARVRMGVMTVEQSDGTLQLGIKNSSMLYSAVDVTMPRAVESAQVRTIFPATTVKRSGPTFTIKVPPRGIVVADVRLAPDNPPDEAR